MENRYAFLIIMASIGFTVFCFGSFLAGYDFGYSSGHANAQTALTTHYTGKIDYYQDTIAYYEAREISEEDRWKKCSLYSADANPDVVGLYFPVSDYYCVWVAGRNIEQINSTDYHEACHALIEREPEHFCSERLVNRTIEVIESE